MENLEKATQNNNGLFLNIALNYGGRDEILRAVKKISLDCKKRILDPDFIDKDLFESYLTRKINKTPLIIRTAGNQRISNFYYGKLLTQNYILLI